MSEAMHVEVANENGPRRSRLDFLHCHQCWVTKLEEDQKNKKNKDYERYFLLDEFMDKE